MLNRDEEALADLTIAIDSPLLQGDDRLRAVVTRLTTFYRLGMQDHAKSELEIFKSIYSIPTLEIYKDTIIIRNIPDCDCSKDLLKSFVTKTFCESERDLTIANGIYIAKRKRCNCKGNQFTLPFKAIKNNAVTNCKYYCDNMQVAANIFCAGIFKRFRCQAACIATVEMIKDGCYWCCRNGDFYTECIEPFEDIIGQMGQGCDPMWD